MQREQDIDTQIKAALNNECEDILASEALKYRIDAAVSGQQTGRKEKNTMKHFGIKKFCVGVAAACLLVSGISVFAGKVDFFVNSVGMEADYTDYRDMEKVQEDLGYEVDSVERFANGYEFEGVSVGFITAISEENGKMYSVPSGDVRYRKEGEWIDLTVNEKTGTTVSDERSKEADATRICGNTTLRYDEYTNKMVPEGYELTEEDKINEQRDDFHIVYLSIMDQEEMEAEGKAASDGVKRGNYTVGTNMKDVIVTLRQTGEVWQDWTKSGEPYTTQTKVVSWEKDGKCYELSGVDLTLSADELFDMAEEILGAGLN